MSNILPIIKSADDSIFQKAIEVFGWESQIDLFIEEASEFYTANHKFKLWDDTLIGKGTDGGVLAKEINPVKDRENEPINLENHLKEEIADVLVMAHQLQFMFGKDEIEELVSEKWANIEKQWEYFENYKHLKEEIVDVLVMAHQLQFMFGKDEIEKLVSEKWANIEKQLGYFENYEHYFYSRHAGITNGADSLNSACAEVTFWLSKIKRYENTEKYKDQKDTIENNISTAISSVIVFANFCALGMKEEHFRDSFFHYENVKEFYEREKEGGKFLGLFAPEVYVEEIYRNKISRLGSRMSETIAKGKNNYLQLKD